MLRKFFSHFFVYARCLAWFRFFLLAYRSKSDVTFIYIKHFGEFHGKHFRGLWKQQKSLKSKQWSFARIIQSHFWLHFCKVSTSLNFLNIKFDLCVVQSRLLYWDKGLGKADLEDSGILKMYLKSRKYLGGCKNEKVRNKSYQRY